MAEQIKYSKILVPTDGSKCALDAGRHAVYIAQCLGAEVLVLNVVDSDLAFRSGLRYGDEINQLDVTGARATAQIKALCDVAGVPAKEIMTKGTPAAEILKMAKDECADCIVMGRTGMSAIERALLGSVSEKVAHNAECPVLLIRSKQASLS